MHVKMHKLTSSQFDQTHGYDTEPAACKALGSSGTTFCLGASHERRAAHIAMANKIMNVDNNILAHVADNIAVHDRLEAAIMEMRNLHEALRGQHDALQAPQNAQQGFVTRECD